MHLLPRRLWAPLVAFLLSACSGTGSPLVTGSEMTNAQSTATFTLTPDAPVAAAAATRAAQYISPATKSIVVVAGDGVRRVVNVAPGSASCAAATAGGPVTCRLTVPVPVGRNTFAVSTYDGLDGAGGLLSTTTLRDVAVPATGVAVPLTLYGVAARAVVDGGSGVVDCRSRSIPIGVTLLDAAGAVIVGAAKFQNGPFALTDSDRTGATKLSTATIASPADAAAVTLAYTGAAIPNPVVSISGGGLADAASMHARVFQPLTDGTIAMIARGVDGTLSLAPASGAAPAPTASGAAGDPEALTTFSQVDLGGCAAALPLAAGATPVMAFSVETTDGALRAARAFALADPPGPAAADPVGTVYRLATLRAGALVDVAAGALSRSTAGMTAVNALPATPAMPGVAADGLYVLYRPATSVALGATVAGASFTTGGAPTAQWRASRRACLTAGVGSLGAASIPACYGYALPDAQGSGALRLASGLGYEAGGAAIFATPIAYAGSPLTVSFDLFAYNGGTPGGVTLFLLDGAAPPAANAADAGGLYAYLSAPGAYLGVGFDALGDFTGVRQSVGVRGAQAIGYARLPGLTAALPFALDGVADASRIPYAPRPTPLTARVVFDPVAGTVSVGVDRHDGRGVVAYLAPKSYLVAGQPKAPASVYVGIGSTENRLGNIFEIRNLVVSK